MNLTRALPLVLLFGSMAFSQSSGKQFSSQSLRATCPIELKASLNSVGKVMPAVPVESGRIAKNEQQLRITLSDPSSDVVAARITVHGFPVGGRVAPAVLHFPSDPAEITKTIDFDQPIVAGQNASITVAVPTFSTVTSISLDSLTYSDGTTWNPETRKHCAAVGLPLDLAGDTPSR